VSETNKTILDIIEGGLAEIFAILFMGLIIALRKLPKKVMRRAERKLIIRDLEKHAKAFSITQDLVDDVGCVYGWAVLYHNHGPEKFTIIYECLGHACHTCINKCNFSRSRKRVQAEWINRPIHKFWLERLALRTLKINGKVNTCEYDDCDDFQKEIFSSLGISFVKEVFIKTKSNSEFITLCLGFCERFQKQSNVDAKMMGAANRINRYL
jgi:hypothetical protein